MNTQSATNCFLRGFVSLLTMALLFVSAAPSAMARDGIAGTHTTAQLNNDDGEPGCD